jgi:hypothetical protein
LASAAPFFTDTKESQLDDLFWRICEELQLGDAMYQQVVQRYEAVCRWLQVPGSPAASLRPSMYPHGSMRIGTTVKPIGRDEHDLDFVCEFQVTPNAFQTPLQILKIIEARLAEHQIYGSMLEMKNRCARLNYSNDFHMDILPACLDPNSSTGGIFVPDRESRSWKPSNPKGYADWFGKRCELVIAILAEEARSMGEAEPLPALENAREKATLKRVVQLWKRWRDIRYRNDPKNGAISMVLTTLAAQMYEGETSVAKAFPAILAKTARLAETSRPRIFVRNPANPQEDLSEKWDDPRLYAAFTGGVRELQRAWDVLLATSGLHKIAGQLETMFGEPAKTAISKQAKSLQELRERAALRVKSTGIITAASTLGIRMRPNTFHGE